MDADEVAGWSELAGEIVARGAGYVQAVHRAVARRLFAAAGRAMGRTATPSRLLHDTISGLAYSSVRRGGRAAGWLAARAASVAWPADAPSGIASPLGMTAQATVVGLIGDQLAAVGSPVSWQLELRAGGRDVPVTVGAVRHAWPAATGRLLLLVPGLCETEHAWRFRATAWWGDPASTYGTRLVGAGWTPVDVRYPSGLSLADNGRDLAAALERLVEVWPVPVEELAIVGHSMGGLVARHAVHEACRRTQAWLAHCRRVVCLGTPHGGSPVARGAAELARGLRARPETAGIGEIIDLRSAGIRDLEHTLSVPPAAEVDVHLVAAVVSPVRNRRLDNVVGDLLVGHDSATGRAADGTRVPAVTTRTLAGLHHFDLLNHPDVDTHLRTILAPPRSGTHP